MFNESFENAFVEAAQTDGLLIERCISHFYTDYISTLHDRCTMIDGGAHNGYHAKKMSLLQNVERVIAIEANPETFRRFNSIITNNPKYQKISLYHAALQNNEEMLEVDFHVSTSHPGRSGINPAMRNLDSTVYSQPIKVPTTTIDALVKGIEDTVRFIKLDLEGGEFAALLGANKTLTTSLPVCVFENGPMTPEMNNYTIDEFLSYLTSVGLKGATVFGDVATEQNSVRFWYGWAFPIDTFNEHSQRLRRAVADTMAAGKTGI